MSAFFAAVGLTFAFLGANLCIFEWFVDPAASTKAIVAGLLLVLGGLTVYLLFTIRLLGSVLC